MSTFQGTMPSLYSSPLGTPVYSDLSIAAGSYTVDGKTVQYNSINLPDAIFSVSKKKRIKTTPVSGATSDVVEYDGSESAEISCTVRIYGSNLKYPLNDMDNFYLMLQCNQPVQVNSWYLNQFGINYAIIMEYSLAQKEGSISDQVIKFTMKEVDPHQYPTLIKGYITMI